MSAFHFGPGRERLYGYYHAPAAAERGQVLICQPWGVEYELAHRTVRFLARKLAEEGWHVLRFDYRGTGDSWGDTTCGDVESWVADTLVAADELRAMTGLDAVELVGLRLGATLCASASVGVGRGGSCVLWDPLLHGPRWTEELQALDDPDDPARSPAGEELGRYTVSSTFRAQIADIGTVAPPRPERRTLVLWTQPGPRSDRWEAAPGRVVEQLDQPPPWVEDIALGSGRIPVAAVARIVDWLDA